MRLIVKKGLKLIFVTNKLPAATTVHWHDVKIICGMDGVPGLTQPAISPGKTFLYEFIFPDSGTFMYHSHKDSMTQEGMGTVAAPATQEDLEKNGIFLR
jgi:manganese oxidase